MPVLPKTPVLLAFLAASLLLAVTPGPGVFYIVARSVAGGFAAGMASVFGVAIGNAGNMLAAVLGMAVVFKIWPLAFTVIKYAGACYLLYLAVEALRRARAQTTDAPLKPVSPASNLRVFTDGLLVALFNPKTMLFFAAFLPQFLGVGAGVAQPLLLGLMFVAVALVTDGCYAVAAASVARHSTGMYRLQHYGRYAMAIVFVGLAVMTVFGLR